MLDNPFEFRPAFPNAEHLLGKRSRNCEFLSAL
jgi:hypothetical protein